MSPVVLYEDNHLLVVAKPAGIPMQSDATGDPSLLELAKSYRKAARQKPGNVYLGLVHRLDRPVSGVALFACTSKAAARLSEQFRSRNVEKRYLAVVERRGQATLEVAGVWEDHLLKREATNVVRIAGPDEPNAKLARTAWRILESSRSLHLVELTPQTGRAHQLRVQSSERGMPIVGDRKYGARTSFPEGIALHAHSLALTHPTRKEQMTFTCPLPETWERFPFRRL